MPLKRIAGFENSIQSAYLQIVCNIQNLPYSLSLKIAHS